MSLKPPTPGTPGFKEWLDLADAVDAAGVLGGAIEVRSTPTFGTWEKDQDSDGRWMVCSGPDTTVCRGIKNEADADLIVALHAAHVSGLKGGA